MFEGYCDRRCLHTLLISVILSLILVIIIYRQQNPHLLNQSSYKLHSRRLNLPKNTSNKVVSYSKLISKTLSNLLPSLQKTPNSILSSIEFVNSPFLDLESESSNIIPILVLSKASNIDIRDAIRRTWAFERFYRNDTIQIKVFFLVGIDDYMIKRIQSEQNIFSDVIQVSVPDMSSFRTYKELSAMIWIRTYLPNTSFYIKTDDDVIINMKSIVDIVLPTIENVKDENLIIGWFGPGHSPSRDTYQKFIDAVLPPSSIDLYYAMNLFYIVTSKAADRMVDTLSSIDSIDHPGDLFVTGILREAANIQIKNLTLSIKNYYYSITDTSCKQTFRNNSKLLFCKSSSQGGSIHTIAEYFDTWNVVLSQN